MKKALALVLSLAMMVALLAGCGGSTSSSDSKGSESSGNKVIKVGVFQPSTGDNGAGGKQEILGTVYAHSLTNTIELGGETYDIELVHADNQSSTEKAVTAAQTLVNAGSRACPKGVWPRSCPRAMASIKSRFSPNAFPMVRAILDTN